MDAITGTVGNTLKRRPTHEIVAEEWQKPANCFTITHVVEEHFALEFDHPMCRGFTSLILGEDSYVARDTRRDTGCIYRVESGQAVVRRAEIAQCETQSGKKFKTIRRLETETPTFALAFVCFGLPEGVSLQPQLEPVWSGVTGGKRIAWGNTAALVEVSEGETLTIFYPDGAVSSISYEDMRSFAPIGKKLTMLEPTEAFEARIVLNNTIAGRTMGSQKVSAQSEDRALHELAAMIRLTRYYPQMLESITKEIAQRAKGVGLRPEVRHHLHRSLRSIGNHHDFWWLKDQSAKNSEPWKPRSPGSSSPLRTGRKTETPEEKRQREVRREANRAARNADRPAKGASGSADPHGNKGKRGKGKDKK